MGNVKKLIFPETLISPQTHNLVWVYTNIHIFQEPCFLIEQISIFQKPLRGEGVLKHIF